MSRAQFLLISTVKNEGPNILEWVAYHRLCGFYRIVICQNDSTDLTPRTLQLMHNLGLITFVNNRNRRGDPQPTAYRQASRLEVFDEAEYCLTLDGDEFFRCDLPGGTVAALVAAADRPDLMHLNWQNFGSGGETELSDGLVLERFRLSADTGRIGQRPEGFKSLFRTDAFRRCGIHRPRFPRREGLRAVNGSGIDVGEIRCTGWRCTDPGGMALARVHHYPIRDAASFVLKRARGSGHRDYRELGQAYWDRFDKAEVEDGTLAARADEVRAEMARLDALSEGRLMRLRRRSLKLWAQMFDARMADPEAAALYAGLCGRRNEPLPAE